MLDCIYLYFPVGHDRLQTVLVMSMHQCKDRLIVAYTVSLAWHCIIIILNLIRLCNWVKTNPCSENNTNKNRQKLKL